MTRPTAKLSLAIAAAITTVTIAGIGLSLSVTLISLRLAQLGYSARAIGFHTAGSGLLALATAPYVPWLARKIGVRRLLIAALPLGAACLAAFDLTHGYWPWLAVRSIYGIALTIMFILGEFWISAVVWPHRRGLVMGIYATAIAAGFAAGPFLLAAVGPGGAAPFLVAALLSLAAMLPIGLAGTDAPVLQKTEPLPFLGILRDAPAATTAALLYGAIEATAFGLFPVFALRQGWGAGAAAVASAVFALGNALLQIPTGLAADRFGRARLLILIGGLGALGALILPLAAQTAYVAYVILLFVWSGIVGGLYAVGLTSLASRYSGAPLARANAAYILLYSAGALIGPPLFGFSLDLAPAGLFIALALALAGFFALALKRDANP
ncbi:cyanate permease [Methylovirgula ligni]|uniref:Cyanate permease n=1 Tax=Methylovirgula ligni TaxID=569860 RepID=A0A3D9YTI3_9HYPH|nr:MFS transporter [Methylovirgula ligni]REF85815.1 cyanate permease [Methylovirgula ligni]